MTDVRLVDVSIRDGNQSLWGAAGLRNEHVTTLASRYAGRGVGRVEGSGITILHRRPPAAVARWAARTIG